MTRFTILIERLSSERRCEKWLAFILLICPFSGALGSAWAEPLLQFSVASRGALWHLLTEPLHRVWAVAHGLLSLRPIVILVLAVVIGACPLFYDEDARRFILGVSLSVWGAALLGSLLGWALPVVVLGTCLLIPLPTVLWWIRGFFPVSTVEYRRIAYLTELGKDAAGRVYALSSESSFSERYYLIELLTTTAQRASDSVKSEPKVLGQFGWITSELSRIRVRDVRLLSWAFLRATAPLYQGPIASRFTQDESEVHILFKPLARFEWTDGAWRPKDLSTLVPGYADVPIRDVGRLLNRLIGSTPEEEAVAQALNRFARVSPSERRLVRQVWRAFDTPWPQELHQNARVGQRGLQVEARR